MSLADVRSALDALKVALAGSDKAYHDKNLATMEKFMHTVHSSLAELDAKLAELEKSVTVAESDLHGGDPEAEQGVLERANELRVQGVDQRHARETLFKEFPKAAVNAVLSATDSAYAHTPVGLPGKVDVREKLRDALQVVINYGGSGIGDSGLDVLKRLMRSGSVTDLVNQVEGYISHYISAGLGTKARRVYDALKMGLDAYERGGALIPSKFSSAQRSMVAAAKKLAYKALQAFPPMYAALNADAKDVAKAVAGGDPDAVEEALKVLAAGIRFDAGATTPARVKEVYDDIAELLGDPVSFDDWYATDRGVDESTGTANVARVMMPLAMVRRSVNSDDEDEKMQDEDEDNDKESDMAARLSDLKKALGLDEGREKYPVGMRVIVSDTAGVDSNKRGTVVSPREVKTDGRGGEKFESLGSKLNRLLEMLGGK